MAEVRPFQGLLYNKHLISNIGDVICPPYDTISTELQNKLYLKSQYNIVRLEEGKIRSTDTASRNQYTRAAETLNKWITGEILTKYEDPAYYLIKHVFKLNNRTITRTGFIGALKLEEYESGIVLPHEHTENSAKRDRFNLMTACHTNFSHIMALYRDEPGELDHIFDKVSKDTPYIEFSTPEESYELWPITHQKQIGTIQKVMSPMKLYIADGHHRYETALSFHKQQTGNKSVHNSNEAHNFIMTYFVNLSDPGLMVYPYHRLLGNLTQHAISSLWAAIKGHFTIESAYLGKGVNLKKVEKVISENNSSSGKMVIVGNNDQNIYFIKPQPNLMSQGRGSLESFQAWMLEEKVFKAVFGQKVSSFVTWIHDEQQALELLNHGKYQFLFLLDKFPIDLFETIIGEGERLPRKSTYFHPKLPTGLVMNPLRGVSLPPMA